MTQITIQLRGFFTYSQVNMMLLPLRCAMRSLRVKHQKQPRIATPKELPHVFSQFPVSSACANDSGWHAAPMEPATDPATHTPAPEPLQLAPADHSKNLDD